MLWERPGERASAFRTNTTARRRLLGRLVGATDEPVQTRYVRVEDRLMEGSMRRSQAGFEKLCPPGRIDVGVGGEGEARPLSRDV